MPAKKQTKEPKQPDNLKLWNQVEKTDPSYTKNFGSDKGFKGTSTNTTYLVKRATEMFGPIGKGWGYEILEEVLMPGHPLDERGTPYTIHKVRLKVWYILDGEKYETPPHMGQTTFIGKNKYGLFTDEEAPKKSVTDALTKTLSLLGFAGDIHLGRYDDNKYVNSLKGEFAPEKQKGTKKAPQKASQKAPQPATKEEPKTTEDPKQPPADPKVIWEYNKEIAAANTIERLTEIYTSAEKELEAEIISQASFDTIKGSLSKKKQNLGG